MMNRWKCRCARRNIHLGMRAKVSSTAIARASRSRIATCVAAGAFTTILLTTPGCGSTGQVVAAVDPGATNRPQDPGLVNAENASCKELKDALQTSGSLTILAGPRGWGGTFYGPRVPRCEFWSRPVFSYVNAKDGLCGVGYICVEKFGAAGGG